MQCRNCNTPLAANSSVCPRCGTPQQMTPPGAPKQQRPLDLPAFGPGKPDFQPQGQMYAQQQLHSSSSTVSSQQKLPAGVFTLVLVAVFLSAFVGGSMLIGLPDAVKYPGSNSPVGNANVVIVEPKPTDMETIQNAADAVIAADADPVAASLGRAG